MSVAAPPESEQHDKAVKARARCSTRPSSSRRSSTASRSSTRRRSLRNPVIFVVEVVSVVVTIRIIADIVNGGTVAFDTAIALGLWFTVLFANFAEAMAEGRGKAQAESLRTHPRGPRRAAAPAGRHRGDRAGLRPAGGRPRDGLGRRADPRRRRDRRGHRLGRRVGDHRRVRARDPRVRRRPLGGHRRHEGALGLDQGADHGRAGRGVHRPDDPPRRGRRAPEDARTRSRCRCCS